MGLQNYLCSTTLPRQWKSRVWMYGRCSMCSCIITSSLNRSTQWTNSGQVSLWLLTMGGRTWATGFFCVLFRLLWKANGIGKFNYLFVMWESLVWHMGLFGSGLEWRGRERKVGSHGEITLNNGMDLSLHPHQAITSHLPAMSSSLFTWIQTILIKYKFIPIIGHFLQVSGNSVFLLWGLI